MIRYENITTLIAELLYKHDCVIIPDFGGFVARHHSATFGKANTLLLPPSKQVLFNKNLVHNDGLLVSAWADNRQMAYQDALVQIAEYKDYLVSILSVKKRFELSQIGLLFLDAENILRFEARAEVNFLIESFGFEPVMALELPVEEIPQNHTAKQFEDRTISTITPVIVPARKKNYLKIAAAITVPVAIAVLFFAAASRPVQPLLQSSLNPFYTPEKIYNPSAGIATKAVFISKIASEPLLEDAQGFASYTLTENNRTLVAASVINTSKADKTHVKKPSSAPVIKTFEGKFQVVVGCFGVEQNAEKLVKELVAKQIEAGISGTNAKGLHVVSCGSFNSKEEALERLNQVKSSYPNAWVMSH